MTIQGKFNGVYVATTTRGKVALPTTVAMDIINILKEFRKTYHLDTILQAMDMYLKHEGDYDNPHGVEISTMLKTVIHAVHEAYLRAGHEGTIDDVVKIIYHYVKIANEEIAFAGESAFHAISADLFNRIINTGHNTAIDGIHDPIIEEKFPGIPPVEAPSYANSFSIINPTTDYYHRPGPVSRLDECGIVRTAEDDGTIPIDFITRRGGVGIFESLNYIRNYSETLSGVIRNGNTIQCGGDSGYHRMLFHNEDPYASELGIQFTISQSNCGAIVVVANTEYGYEPVAIFDDSTIESLHEKFQVDMLHGAAGRRTYVVKYTEESINLEMGLAFISRDADLNFTGDTKFRFNLEQLIFTSSPYVTPYPAAGNEHRGASLMSIGMKDYLNSSVGTLHIIRTNLPRIVRSVEPPILFRLDGDLSRIEFTLFGSDGYVSYTSGGVTHNQSFMLHDVGTEELSVVFTYDSPRINLYINGHKVYSADIPNLQFSNPVLHFPEKFRGFIIGAYAYMSALSEKNAEYLSV